MKQNKRFRWYISSWSNCSLLLWVVYSGSIHALPNDGDQPIIIDSNTATWDDVKATSTYTGNVISIQGSIRVNSDKLVVYFVNGEADKMVFTGNLAKFKQKPKEGDADTTGEALTGEYYPKKKFVNFNWKSDRLARQWRLHKRPY